MEKRTLLAVVISIIVLIAWQWLFMPNARRPNPSVPATLGTVNKNVPASQQERPDTAPAKSTGNMREEEIKTVRVETAKAIYELSENEASIIQCAVKEIIQKKKSLVELVLAGRLLNDAGSGIWEYVPQSGKPYSAKFVNSSGGFEIEKIFEFSDDSYIVGIKYSIQNGKNAKKDFKGINLSMGPGLGTDAKEMKENKRLLRAISYSTKKVDKLKPGSYDFSGKWAGIDNRYFLSVFFKNDDSFKNVNVSESDKMPLAVLSTGEMPLAAGEVKNFNISSYIGPKGYNRLCLIKPMGIDCELQKAVDFGFFSDLGKLALVCLDYFFNITHNYGWSIVIISLILNIISFPLSRKSFKSAQAMKAIQGDVKFLQTKYKGDPQKMNTEIWNLYKTKGVSPFSGCLPMLIQLPIFWALFTMLRNAYELRGASWIFWINDLSKPDMLFTISGFHVPFLPIVMGAGMFVQQWMTTPASDPTQKQMMYFMPIIFTVMFFGFPSGLVIYWLTNSIVTILTQWVMLKKTDAV